MMRRPSNRFHAELDLTQLGADHAARQALIDAILELAPKSSIYLNNPTVQQAVAALGTTLATVKSAGATVAATAKQYKIDLAAETAAIQANDRALLLVKNLSENFATSAGDLASMAFNAVLPKPSFALAPPVSVDITMGKRGHGNLKVSAHQVGTTRRHYMVETSPDPIGPNSWTLVPGTGKSRRLTGKSGTSLWVRFALVRGQGQSDWGTPVLVTFP
jgi:hypothetical protein